MTILVTGPTGTVGHYVLERALVGNEKVRVLALPETLHRLPHRNEIEVVPGTLESDEAVAEAVQGVDKIYHTVILAPPPFQPIPDMERVNVQGTRRLLEQCAGDIKRFVYVSTVFVYQPHSEEEWPVKADAGRQPHGNQYLTAYAQTVVDAEDFIYEAHERYGMDYTILRTTTACGRGARYAESVVSDLMRNPQRADLIDRTRGTMQWVHGSDLARAVIAAGTSDVARNQHYLIAGLDWINSYRILSLLWDITQPTNETNPYAELAETKKPHMHKFDYEKAKTALGYMPIVTLRQILEEMLGRYEFHTAASLNMPNQPSLAQFEL